VSTKPSFLVLSKEKWNQPRRARKQLLPEALLNNGSVEEILYVDPPRHLWQQANVQGSMPKGMMSWQGKFLLPGERFSWVRKINRWYMSRELQARMAHREQWYTLFYHPWDVDLIGHLKKIGPVLFDWTEDWSEFHQNEEMRLAQEQCIRSATAVLTVTEDLAQKASSLRGSSRDVLLLPNATALPLLDESASLSLPDEIAEIPEPRIGYAGHMGPWFNTDLLISLAIHQPDWHWLLVGYANQDIAIRIHSLPNVHMVGEKPLSELQSYLAQCQILVAPYQQNICGDASKLYDYMTIGRPIVSSDIETARRLGKCVKIAKTTEQWIQAISEGLSGEKHEDKVARREVILECSWPVRAKTLSKWLASNGNIR